jgi:outer membrane protein assembly factor BamB
MATLAALLVSGLVAQAEPDEEPPAPRHESILALHTDPAAEKRLRAVEEYLKQQAWAEAARLLQAVLDGPDAFVAVRGADGKELLRWTTLHAEADRRLRELPAPAREFYERTQNGAARALLAQAEAANNPQLLGEAARRYLHTPAGAEATRLLAVHYLDRGQPALAARCFERLLALPGGEGQPPAMLFAAFLAFERAGDTARAEALWKQLTARAPGGLRLGNRVMGLADLRAALARERRPAPDASADWPLFRGDAARTAAGSDAAFPPEAKWGRDTAHETATRTWLQQAVRQHDTRGTPALSAFFPLAIGDRVVCRSHRGIHALEAATGKPLWEYESEGGLDTLGQDLRQFPYLEAWVNAHLQHNPQLLLGNPLTGALNSDGERVYAVEDLAVPPHQNTYQSRGRPVAVLDYAFSPALSEAARHNRLIALDLHSGKLLWERGGPGTARRRDELYPCFFLGPPLPVAGKLYVLLEREQEQRLACLDAASGRLLWLMPLGIAPTRLLTDPARRTQAVHLAYADGVLVCPTNAGLVLGVDPFGRSLLWAYAYREPVPLAEADPPAGRGWGRGRSMPIPEPLRPLRPNWVASAPILYQGRCILTAPDDLCVHCLSLRDGTPQWKVKQNAEELYVAGVGRGKVLLIGKQACRALDLADGKARWETETGVPAGLGVIGDSAFYLPLKAAAKDGLPAVCALDLASGRVQAQVTLPREAPPGNLVLCREQILSQTAATLTAYPRRGR